MAKLIAGRAPLDHVNLECPSTNLLFSIHILIFSGSFHIKKKCIGNSVFVYLHKHHPQDEEKGVFVD